MIPPLVQAGYRVVVPDFIGFGKSDKYSAATNYTHEMHLFCLKHLMEGLDLTSGVTLVCQDWGGIILISFCSKKTKVKIALEIATEITIKSALKPCGHGPF